MVSLPFAAFQVVRCHLSTIVAALVITIYDHLITLDTEVEYVWSKRWSKSKGLFIIARYLGDILLISVCIVFSNFGAASSVL
ncbi:hypothetical protein GALMADRAFT_637921 [Galerina marginata CBS 339.88]|uniref:DUF6533 domain-containing protein n=1 Tax=Galerina marginata (strain CBS 339.88) TaxID=685588 RepID=A0A067TJP4_GALM3|nr:hypothetical protein GALMADRAFT_637921 [Galerina marginata CBS 339.88]